MDRRTAITAAEAVALAALLVLAYASGWFGGGGEAPPLAVAAPDPARGTDAPR